MTPLFGFTREIEIRDIAPTLRQLRVIVRYPTSNGKATVRRHHVHFLLCVSTTTPASRSPSRSSRRR